MIQWLSVGLISAWDCFLAIRLRNVLSEAEQNPLGRLLIWLDGDDVSFLALWKFTGTILVLGIFILLYERIGSMVHWIMTPIFILQLCLLFYLSSC